MTTLVPDTDQSDDRAILTLALGPSLYRKMAINLARSIRLWHPAPGISITIVTDDATPLPRDLCNVRLLVLGVNELGIGFQTKLHLDRLTSARHTLFIDADCLVYEPLDRIFARLASRPVATIGGSISDGEWFGDVRALCRQLGVAAIPKFNGGLYYLERGDVSSAVYQRARELAARYDQLGLVRLRGQPNDELIMASAMALSGLAAMPDDGTYISDPQACPGPLRVNVLRGRHELTNPPLPSTRHQSWYPFARVRPAIVHYLGHHANSPVYRTEVLRLRLAAQGWPVWLADVTGSAGGLPWHAKEWTKDLLRPMFRRLIGRRRVRSTAR